MTGTIMQCCFEVMKELETGFLERIYKNALLIALLTSSVFLDSSLKHNDLDFFCATTFPASMCIC